MQGRGLILKSGSRIDAWLVSVKSLEFEYRVGFRIHSAGFRIYSTGCRIQSAGFRVRVQGRFRGSELGVYVFLGLRV